MKTNRSERGNQAELLACEHLQSSGLRLLESNYHCRMGEVDLIMLDKNCYVFVEVRMRSSAQFGGALASITPSKQRKVRISAQHYLQSKNLFEKVPVRFDVVALNSQDIEWIQGAF
jgi:putative endonuclease